VHPQPDAGAGSGSGDAKAEIELIRTRYGAYVPAEYQDIARFLDFLAEQYHATGAEQGDIYHPPTIPIPDAELRKFLSEGPIQFSDVNHPARVSLAPEGVLLQGRMASGPAYTALLHVGYTYSWKRQVRISLSDGRAVADIGGVYRLAFRKSFDDHYALVGCEYLMSEGE
jgi:hypothetical protein